MRLAAALARSLALGLCPAVVVLVLMGPARADLRVCNQSTNPVSIALGYRAEKGWQSEGWWVAPPAKCAVVYQGDLHSRFFYLYVADDISGGAWHGNNFMCTRDETFTIFGVGDCLARGYERTGFFELDTQNRAQWTVKLIDGVAAPSASAPAPPLLGPAPPVDPNADLSMPNGTDVMGVDPGAMD